MDENAGKLLLDMTEKMAYYFEWTRIWVWEWLSNVVDSGK